ncbi:MAG: hypothetical protein P0Y56_03660 [Candidatus Andeanibacterium colombiense]|uniref:Uncharacterized protein n=1 Tax=Candidatus Andeanibacterium colombiense TaxID=3121345 RepID=A0AAJ6BNG5_9SPHN|nr:MAG: hypothetical protein P0Y56_03660 [Sphingomonadaceae bacterium]
MTPRLESPEPGKFAQNIGLSGLLGIAAAGISAYVLTDATHTDAVRLLFLALISGLAFPAVLTSAMDTKGQQTSRLQQEVLRITDNATTPDIGETAKAAKELRLVLAQNPAESVKPDGQGVIDTMAQQAVNNIAQTPATKIAEQRQVVEELKEVGTVAQNTGWDKTTQAVIDQLKILGEKTDNDALKASAAQAVERLSEPAKP